MKTDRLTHVLLLIAGLLLFVNGICAFEQSLPMLLISSLLLISGVCVSGIAVKLFWFNSNHRNVKLEEDA
ncbi:hypothetical protein [Staphylococcus edaphicus]|uniref:Uncharacterized protein n=1 Tax=Staphylococcus edaphicus TaxID=1955013 RepID=A0A2C6WMH3_9STAP|nr:hypothetical protein [Staphylococcus edaphicus]PHK49285.1 hypothetical protein BTJ66_08935 [Staphylococcus edaphicus]UQW81011.1 hypothetical protein MNY58_10550 [Staphylococcus edaphicus]